MAFLDNPFVRGFILLLHAVASIWLVSWMMDYDITSRWLSFIGFILVLLLLLFLFVRHIISFYYFLKTKTK